MDEGLYDARFFDLVGLGGLPPQGTLEGASGLKSDCGPYATSLIEQCETAWRTPYRDLTCAQVRTLVSQRIGLEWLGRPVLEFATRYPLAEIENYPGEMGVLCLRAADHLICFAEPEFRAWMGGDFGWFEKAFGWSRIMLRDASAALEAARAVLRSQ